MLLYDSLTIRSLTLPNRWVMSPMCMYTAKNGVANEFHLTHYLSRAQGGVGMIVVEATGIVPEGRITSKCLGLWNDEQELALKKIVDAVHRQTATKMSIQLNHSGRKGSTQSGVQVKVEDGGWLPAGPSPVAYQPADATPRELSIVEINRITEDFKNAAERAVRAGFDAIEIHAAHGYLLHQFLSPVSNLRVDDYGGSFENRIRFLLGVVDDVRDVIPEEMPLIVRISGTEYAESGGWDIEESTLLAAHLKERGVDIIDVSSGGNVYNAKVTPYTAFHNKLAATIKHGAEVFTGTVGLIDNAETAEEILQSGDANLIFVGRALLRNPYLPLLESFKHNQECFMHASYHRGKPFL